MISSIGVLADAVKQTLAVITLFIAVTLVLDCCSRSQESKRVVPIAPGLAGPLIPSTTTIVTAWDIPKNPLADSSLINSPLAGQVRWGFRLFMDTPHEAPRFTHNGLSCNNCHLNGGQREKAMPLVGIAGVYPEYSQRAGRLMSLEDRIVSCFLRSENATDKGPAGRIATASGKGEAELPLPTSDEVLALSAYLTWLSKGYPIGTSPPWRGQNTIPGDKLIPIEKIDISKGRLLFTEKCTPCHGTNGEGVQIGDKKAGPLWGPESWNDGAGAARIYTLAGIIRHTMPYLDPGSLTDEEAQNVAAYINAKPRPQYPFKREDYLTGKIPADAVYYPAKQ